MAGTSLHTAVPPAPTTTDAAADTAAPKRSSSSSRLLQRAVSSGRVGFRASLPFGPKRAASSSTSSSTSNTTLLKQQEEAEADEEGDEIGRGSSTTASLAASSAASTPQRRPPTGPTTTAAATTTTSTASTTTDEDDGDDEDDKEEEEEGEEGAPRTTHLTAEAIAALPLADAAGARRALRLVEALAADDRLLQAAALWARVRQAAADGGVDGGVKALVAAFGADPARAAWLAKLAARAGEATAAMEDLEDVSYRVSGLGVVIFCGGVRGGGVGPLTH